VGHTTTDGTAVFTTRNGWTRSAQINTVNNQYVWTLKTLTEPRAVSGWYDLGVLIVRSGDFDGTSVPIAVFDASGLTCSSLLQIDNILTANAWVEVIPGCNKTEDNCHNKFDNIPNRMAETFAPGRDLLLSSVLP
jgi:hypothetical protein